MKKQLLNRKRLTQLFYSLTLIFISVNSSWSQTVLQETFGAADVAAPFTGGTSTPSVTYTQTGGTGAVSAVLNGSDAYLSMTSTGANSRPTLTGTLPTSPSGLVATLKNNTKLVTWRVNIKTNRLGTNSTTSYAEGKYYMAVVLCASNSGILGSTAPTGSDGYAIVYQKNTVTGTQPSVSLIKFHNGVGNSSTTADAQELCTATRLIESPALAVIPVTATYAALSVQVDYNPNFDSWKLSYREDPGTTITSPFVDPTTGSLTSAGTIIDNSYTSTAMTNFGFIASTQTNNGYKFQFDNFQIGLSTLTAFTPPPTVEKRQSIHNSPAPKVANLVPEPSVTIKWYAAATGGSALLTTDLITTGTYYATQTLAGTESERVIAYVYVGDTSLKTLPLYEPFNYPVASATTDNRLVVINNDLVSGTGYGSWSVVTGTAALSPDDIVIAAQPVTWTSSILPTPTANALTFDKSGLDPQLLFDAPTTGSVYASCLFMVTNLNAITAGISGTSTDVPPAPGHIFSFANANAAPGSNTSYTAAVYLKSSTVAGAFNIGINAAPADPIVATDIVWDATDYAINTPITLVTRYSYDDLISKLWINPVSTSEPAANATTLPRATALAVDRIRLSQISSATTPFVTLDEIRVANNWGQAIGGSSTLGLSSQVASQSQSTVYPNPVSNGKLYISSPSSSQKQVAIYSILGQKVLEAKTTNNAEINVSKLAKGNYILKITEDGKSEAKKLIVQ